MSYIVSVYQADIGRLNSNPRYLMTSNHFDEMINNYSKPKTLQLIQAFLPNNFDTVTAKNNRMVVDIDGTTYTITIPTGYYPTRKALLDIVVSSLNNQTVNVWTGDFRILNVAAGNHDNERLNLWFNSTGTVTFLDDGDPRTKKFYSMIGWAGSPLSVMNGTGTNFKIPATPYLYSGTNITAWNPFVPKIIYIRCNFVTKGFSVVNIQQTGTYGDWGIIAAVPRTHEQPYIQYTNHNVDGEIISLSPNYDITKKVKFVITDAVGDPIDTYNNWSIVIKWGLTTKDIQISHKVEVRN